MVNSESIKSMKHPLEDQDSWDWHIKRAQESSSLEQGAASEPDEPMLMEKEDGPQHRNLRKHHKHGNDATYMEKQREKDFWKQYEQEEMASKALQAAEKAQRKQRLNELYAHSGIAPATVHGLMIDAGSTGSRMHVYEWEPRTLETKQEITAAVSGKLLSFPGTESRWTDRLRPGLDTFSDLHDEEALDGAVREYLKPLFDFAKSVLHTKQEDFGSYPVYLRATAGMRILNADDRSRIMDSVRRVMKDTTFNPFLFHNEFARTLSGEEEAIYDWAGVNFLLGDLVEQSRGAGLVTDPQKTHGALDLGGGSTQISFFEPKEDIMANLFKLQIGQAKHWNLYAHSFLFYGMNEAINRHEAHLAAGKSSQERIIDGIYDPCLPRGAKVDVRTDIHISPDGAVETWDYTEMYPSGNGNYAATLYNDGRSGLDPKDEAMQCLEMTKDLLHLDKNVWCNFSHKGDCSMAGVYQPKLPSLDSDSFGEFIAFSNYHHVWKFLHLPERATIQELYDATQHACSLDQAELVAYARGKFEQPELNTYCFRSAYVFQLLHNGYGFRMEDSIRVSKVINGQKVGWALGAMLYEINTLPWTYVEPRPAVAGFAQQSGSASMATSAIGLISVALVFALLGVFLTRWRRQAMYKYNYDTIKESDGETSPLQGSQQEHVFQSYR